MDTQRRYTLADLDTLPEDGRRFELADGWLLVSPMARRRHQIGCVGLGDALKPVCPPELYVFPVPINVDDPDATHFEPDLTVVRRAFADIELLDVDAPSLRILELDGEDYVERAYVVGDQPVSVTLAFPVTLVPARLMEL